MGRKFLTYTLFIASLSLVFPSAVQGQNKNLAKKDLLHQGNKSYKRAEYPRADSLYAAAVAVDTSYATGWYNLGNSLYLGGDGDKAKASWMKSLLNTPETGNRSDIFYNLGGVEMDKKNYAEAIKLYKDALRKNPSDEQARYNLALAQQLLKDQQNQQNKDNKNNNDQNKDNKNNNDQNKDNKNNNDQNKDNKNNNDQNKDNKNNNDQNKDNKNNNDQNKDNKNNNDQNKDDKNNNDQNKDNKNNNDQNKDNKNNNDQGGGGSSPQNAPQKLSPSDEQMLRAIGRQEQGTQEKVKGKQTDGVKIRTDKDW